MRRLALRAVRSPWVKRHLWYWAFELLWEIAGEPEDERDTIERKARV